MFRSLLPSLIGVIVVKACYQSIDDIDRSNLIRINLKPNCEAITYTYAGGIPSSVDAIFCPFWYEGYLLDAFDYPQSAWRQSVEGPGVSLKNEIRLAKAQYVVAVTYAAAAARACVLSAWSSYRINAAFCLGDYLSEGSDAVEECEAGHRADFTTARLRCSNQMLRRIEDAMTTCNASIDAGISAYGGCNGFTEMLDAWEMEFYNLPRK